MWVSAKCYTEFRSACSVYFFTVMLRVDDMYFIQNVMNVLANERNSCSVSPNKLLLYSIVIRFVPSVAFAFARSETSPR